MNEGLAALRTYENTNLVKLNQAFEQNGKDLDELEKNFLEGLFFLSFYVIFGLVDCK